MSGDAGPIFLDTNIFVYTFDGSAPRKARLARELVKVALDSGQGVVSYQVAQEFFNIAFRKFARPMEPHDAEEYFRSVLEPMMDVHSSPELFREALSIRRNHSFGWYDSLIVAAAIRRGCATLYSEDMQHGLKIGSLRIVNPFASRSS